MEGSEDVRPADQTLELARAVYKSELSESSLTKNNTVASSESDTKVSDLQKKIKKNGSANLSDTSESNPSVWKRSAPKAVDSSQVVDRKGPEGIYRSESLVSESSEANLANGNSRDFDSGVYSHIANAETDGRTTPVGSIRPLASKQQRSNGSSTKLAPIIPPAANVDPLAAKTILGSIRRGINPSKEANIVSTLNVIDNQMAMAGIGIHSRAALFISLLEENAQQSILTKADLVTSWEALRAYLVDHRASRIVRSDVMGDFIQCARSLTVGSAESCARLAIELLGMMTPATTAKLGIPTFIAAIPDERLRLDFHDLYEMTLSSNQHDSDDETSFVSAFFEAAKLIDKRKRTLNAASDRPKRGHRRENSTSNSLTSEKSQALSSRRGIEGASSFHSTTPQKRTPRLMKKTSTRVYDRLTGEELVVERDRQSFSSRIGHSRAGSIDNDNESVVSGRSGKSGYSRAGTYAGQPDGEMRQGKSIVTVYNYPKELPLTQLVEMTTPPSGRAPVMIRHKDGLVKILYSDSAAAREVTELINNCTVNNAVLGATIEIRDGDQSMGTQSRRLSPPRPLPSFAGKTPSMAPVASDSVVLSPVFPEKDDPTQLWDFETNLFVGLFSLVLAGLCSGLGNSLETVSPLVYLHIYFLLIGFEFFNRGMDHSWHGFVLNLMAVIITQGLGGLLGFAYFFSYPDRDSVTINVTLMFSLLLWIGYAIVAVLLEYVFRYKFPNNTAIPFVFPAAHTMVTTVLYGTRYGTFSALGNAVIDYAPLRQVAAAFGIGGVNFIGVLIPTLFFLKTIRHEFRLNLRYTVGFYFAAVFIIVVAMGFVDEGDYLYQRSSGFRSKVTVSCISGRDYEDGGTDWEQVWESSKTRLQAGDAFVMWADRTLSVDNGVAENALIGQAELLVKDFGSNASYLGVAYQRVVSRTAVRDMFVLVGPGGHVQLRHQKVLPIPFVDDHAIESGSENFKSFESKLYGKIGVGLGFEVSNPSYMRQAGFDNVDLLLQPLWSHAGIGRRRYDTDAVRAIENGFTLFRCDSNGISGVISPRGEFIHREFVKIDSSTPTVFSLPLRNRIKTFYTSAGFTFDYICVAFTCIFWIFAIIPSVFLDYMKKLFIEKEEPRQHNIIITRESSAEEYDMNAARDPQITALTSDDDPFRSSDAARVLGTDSDNGSDLENGRRYDPSGNFVDAV